MWLLRASLICFAPVITFSFSAIVVIGDKKGNIGYGFGKALEVIEAKEKAKKQAKSNMFYIPLKNKRTIYHDIIGKFSSSIVKIRSAPTGKGVIAGGVMRSIFKVLGIHIPFDSHWNSPSRQAVDERENK